MNLLAQVMKISSTHTMLTRVVIGLLVFHQFVSVSAAENGFSHCDCDEEEEGYWSIDSILQCQKVSDFLIATAYFSIPIEILYFLSCSSVPFKWVLFEFIAFIVLCGMTHLLNAWTYNVHPFRLMLALTVFKFLTALVSCATAITLVTLIPLLLKVKVREVFLKKKAWELDREVGMMKKQKEAGWHVRMLTHEIRKSLNRHTILYTTLIELSKTLDLKNCVVWMPNEGNTVLNLTHELNGKKSSSHSIPISDPDVIEIEGSEGAKILRPDSALGLASSSGSDEVGAVAAIRMQMLRVSDFKGGTPELIQACYAILVLVLPGESSRVWSFHELEMVEVVADQVAVALSHAAVLEESQLMREKLVEQNRALLQARKDAMMASQARISFQKVMSKGMRRPMHSISGLLSMIQQGKVGDGQRIAIDTMAKTSSVLSTLINDVMEISATGNGRFALELRNFGLHSMIKEAACLAKCFCVSRDFDFSLDIENSLPDFVLGDEKRIFQVLLHMVGNLLNGWDSGGHVTFQVSSANANHNRNDQRMPIWKPNSYEEYASVKFEISINTSNSQDSSMTSVPVSNRKYSGDGIESVLGFNVCKKLVQMMQGNIRVIPNSRGIPQITTLILRFHVQPSFGGASVYEPGASVDRPPSESLFRGLQVILADDDAVNRLVTRKLLEKLGCNVSAVPSGFECLNTLGSTGNLFRIVLLDLHMPEMDGFEVAMRIRKYGSGNKPLIVALTASADENIGEKCLQVGMNGVIRKPVLLEGLAEEFRRVLKLSI